MSLYSVKVNPQECLKPGKPLIISISDPELKGTYKSTIFDLDFANNLIRIGMPSYQGRFIPVPNGTRLYVKMMDRSSMFVFQSVSINYEKDKDGFLVAYIAMPEEVRKIQRRQFVRVPMVRRGEFHRVRDDKTYPFVSRDISAGGMLIISNSRLDLGEMIKIHFIPDDTITLNQVKSIVKRYGPQIDLKHWSYGIQFQELTRNTEDELVRFIFRLEQEIRKKTGKKEEE